MEVQIVVPTGTDMSVVEKEYPDIYLDEENFEGHSIYFVGHSEGEGEGDEWLTHDDAVECCGFIEGAIPKADTLIDGNGSWAQGMLSRKDFSGLAVDDALKIAYKATSDAWWRAYDRGRLAAESSNKKMERTRNHMVHQYLYCHSESVALRRAAHLWR